MAHVKEYDVEGIGTLPVKMHMNKKTNDSENWLLCPSKGNPGKFYYFNVVTGESVWSCDPDNKGIRENEHRLSENCHNCHAPTEDGPTSSTNIPTSSTNTPTFRPYYEPRSPYVQPMPIFGQTPYPKYAPDQELRPNIVWAPIQLPVFGQEPKKPLIDKVTQTNIEKITETELKLCNRCKCHENSTFSLKTNEIVKPPFRTSTPKKTFTFETYGETDLDGIQVHITPSSPKKVTGNVISPISHENKVEIAVNKVPNEENVLENLERTDLRFLLIAKRRKSVDAGVNGPTEKKKIFELKQPTPKKRVTFNMSNIDKVDENHSNLSEVNNMNSNPNTKDYITNEASIFDPQIPEKPKYLDGLQSDTWCLVVDTDVLLLDYEIIDNIVLSDTKCKLLIPYAVKSDIEALCIGDCQGQQRVKNARQITRRLVSPPQHYIIQPCPNEEDSFVTTESVLKCCVQATTSNHQVILITNDPYLQSKAKLFNITNYKLNDIKYNFNPNKPFEFKNLKINPNHVKENENIVKENSLNVKVKKQVISKEKPTYSLFDCENSINTNKPKSIKINETDTSDINQKVKNLKMTDFNITKPVSIKNPFFSKETSIPTNLWGINSKKIESASKLKNVTAFGAVTEKRTNDFDLLSLEDESLHRFTVKSEEMNEKLTSRMDEWICTYTQIMEDVLHALLQINSDFRRKTVAPLSLQETFHSIQMVYTNNTKIKTIVKKLSNLLDKCTTKNGKLILAPDDFMTILGYGVFLVQELKSIQQNSKELADAATHIHSLLNNIESETSEDDPDRFKTAPVSRSEYDDQQEIRSNFVKDPSNVIDYLKKHYIQWAEFAENTEAVTEKTTLKNDYNILRTSGKHLNKLKIDCSKNISLNTNEDITNPPKTIKLLNQINIKNLETDYENLQKSSDSNKIIDNPFKNKNINFVVEKDVKNQEKTKIKEMYNNSSVGPKIIRCVNKIDQYENKIKESLDLDALDYSEIVNTHEYEENSEINDIHNKFVKNSDATASDIDNYLIDKQETDLKNNKNESTYEISDDTSIILNVGKTTKTCRAQNKPNNIKNAKITQNISKIDSIPIIKQNIPKIYDNTPKIDHNISKIYSSGPHTHIYYENDPKSNLLRDDNTNDSGFENDSTYALSTIKLFFSELCSTFRLVHEVLIVKFRVSISKGELGEIKKNEFHYQASKSLEYFKVIIQHLKSIIERESADDTVLKGLLLKAGLEASMDKRMTHYRQVAIKFLEQAQILEIGLKDIVSVTIGDFGALSSIEESATSKYYNIFEQSL